MQFFGGLKGVKRLTSKALCAVSVLLFVVLVDASAAWAAKVTLMWNSNVESDLGGYKLYYGRASGAYQGSVQVGSQNHYTLSGLQAGHTYFFAVTAYDIAGNESGYSVELGSVTIVDDVDNSTDTDGDGISDARENQIGTNPHNADTDGDGISDGQELIDNTNPLDQGSSLEVLGTELCSEWNGFLGGMWNVLELSNQSHTKLNAEVKMYDNMNHLRAKYNTEIPSGGQSDILVHDFADRRTDAYGKTCVTFNGVAGDLNGRMVYYKGNIPTASTSDLFQFAFAMPFSSGRKGDQYVPFNTFNPSLDSRDIGNVVANWIQLTNLSNEAVPGKITFYNMYGGKLATTSLTIPAGARHDVAAHEYGLNVVGLVKWSPTNPAHKIQMRNVRYVYDNRWQVASFDTATQVAGQYGTGELITVPLDTRSSSSIIELANVSGQTVTADIYIYNAAGIEQEAMQVTLTPYSQVHIVTDELLGLGVRGLAVIKGSKASSIIATAMQYSRDNSGGVNYMYGVPGEQALGSVLKGSYNTFLGQEAELILLNPTNSAQTASVDIVRSTGEGVRLGHTVTIPAHGVKVVRVNDYEMVNNYGVVTVQPQISNSLVAWMVRKRDGEYAMPIPVKP